MRVRYTPDVSSQISEPSKPRDRVGPYRIEARLGVGGMGAVYRAWDERLKRPVAIKHILPEVDDPQLRERFRREAQAAASLNHSSIVHIYDIVEDIHGEWIVMELIEGARLDLLLRQGALSLAHALRFGREIARGLAEAHTKGIIHRDLKVENVMITRGGRAKILDFGLAKILREVQEPDMSTTQGAVLGTARVMSPEQAMGLGVDHRSDLFSFGTLLYEMLTGASPFKADAVVETLKRVCTLRQRPALELREQIPDELSDLIDHLLEKDPEHRPQSAGNVVLRLVKISEKSVPESIQGPRRESESDVLDPDTADMDIAALGFDLGASSADRESFKRALEALSNAPPERLTPTGRRESTTVPHRPLAGQARDFRAEAESPTSSASSMSRDLSGTRPLEATALHFARKEGERRQVTVLCCDLLGELPGADSESPVFSVLDPEMLFEVMAEFRILAQTSIQRFSGHLGEIQGHRLWAYFGYPRAHEDDAERAVRSALDLVERVRGMTRSNSGSRPPLALRAGIHTGQAVVTRARASVGDIALGPTLEQAAGIHDLVEPHGVVISEETRRLITDSFDTEALAPTQPRGFQQAHAAHRVLKARDARSRWAGANSGVAFVGRKVQLVQLLHLWRRVREGRGQMALISGEAGFGKSRLVQALREHLRLQDHQWWITSASPFTRNSPLHPIVEMAGAELPRTELAPVEAGHEPWDRDSRTVLNDLLRQVQGPMERSKALLALADFFLEKARERPAVLVVEDLQWADASTLEWLDLLLGRISSARFLLVTTFRPDFDLPWENQPGLTHLELPPLDERESAKLIERLTRAKPLPPEIRHLIQRRTDGVPVFIEELTKSILESGLADPSPPGSDLTPSASYVIPTTLRDSLTARLDRLGSAKVLAQRAAVIGRKFSRDLLLHISPRGGPGLEQDLDRLIQAELVNQDPALAEQYLFRHALIQEVAYRSLLKKDRQGLHLEIARALENDDLPPEVIARHYTRAHQADEAARCWLEAGRGALERSAHVEAVEHLRKGLKVLGGLPPGGARDWLEFNLECALLPAVHNVAPPSAAPAASDDTVPLEARELMGRAKKLCEEIARRQPEREREARELLARSLADSQDSATNQG